MIEKFRKLFKKEQKAQEEVPPKKASTPPSDATKDAPDQKSGEDVHDLIRKMLIKRMLGVPPSSPSSSDAPLGMPQSFADFLKAIAEDDDGDPSSEAPEKGFNGEPVGLPPRNEFKPGDLVVLNEHGSDNLMYKIAGKVPLSRIGLALKAPSYGCVIQMLPTVLWSNFTHQDGVIGASPLTPADCIIAAGDLDGGDPDRVEIMIRYSGYLKKAPEEITKNFVGMSAISVFPEAKHLMIGDTVTMDPSLESHPHHHLKSPQMPNYAVVVDVFPTQFICPDTNSWEGKVRPYDCVLSMKRKGSPMDTYYLHYSGWLQHAPR